MKPESTASKSDSSVAARNIRDEIVNRRRQRIAAEGHTFGSSVPESRTAQLVPFTRAPLVICEIKRRSPSRGSIAVGLDPVAQAKLYVDAGVQSVSILTEEDHFGGSLSDLVAVKNAFPNLAVLRKDFLVDEEDIHVAWRAGADAVLLIASMLDRNLLGTMLRKAESLGMAALVEVHSREEIDKIRPFKPALAGINCRDLENFRIDRLLPVGLRPFIDWTADVVFESGIFTGADAAFARAYNFQGILVGEAVVRNPAVIPDLLATVGSVSAPAAAPFWQVVADKLVAKRGSPRSNIVPRRPLVKICGITREDDGRLAMQLGADLLGFVFAASPRRSNAAAVRALANVGVPRVAVVVNEIPDDLKPLLEEGLIDAIQFSGDESPAFCAAQSLDWYKTLRVASVDQLKELENWRCPRILLETWSPSLYGGTGKQLDPELVQKARSATALWMAGGIGPGNIGQIISDFQPELVDLSSSLESEPGHKDPGLMRRFFQEIEAVTGLR